MCPPRTWFIITPGIISDLCWWLPIVCSQRHSIIFCRCPRGCTYVLSQKRHYDEHDPLKMSSDETRIFPCKVMQRAEFISYLSATIFCFRCVFCIWDDFWALSAAHEVGFGVLWSQYIRLWIYAECLDLRGSPLLYWESQNYLKIASFHSWNINIESVAHWWHLKSRQNAQSNSKKPYLLQLTDFFRMGRSLHNAPAWERIALMMITQVG